MNNIQFNLKSYFFRSSTKIRSLEATKNYIYLVSDSISADIAFLFSKFSLINSQIKSQDFFQMPKYTFEKIDFTDNFLTTIYQQYSGIYRVAIEQVLAYGSVGT